MRGGWIWGVGVCRKRALCMCVVASDERGRV